MVLDKYRLPVRMVDDVSSAGLGQGGYTLPVECFGPFRSALHEVISEESSGKTCVDGFRRSLNSIRLVCERAIAEGSTFVRKQSALNRR